jgi:hypothetical protein
MKNILLFTTFLGLMSLIVGCEKEVAPVSKVVIEAFPKIVLGGTEVVVLQVGQSFTDEGAKVNPGYTESGERVSDTAAPSISIKADSVKIGSAEGIYFVPYTYRNKYGFETTLKRKVVVVTQAYTSNFAGQWKRTSNNVIATWKNLGSGVHSISDPGGANIPTDVLYVIIKNDNSVIIPMQTMASGAEIVGLNTFSLTASVAKYAFISGNGVYGTALRTFNKQ